VRWHRAGECGAQDSLGQEMAQDKMAQGRRQWGQGRE